MAKKYTKNLIKTIKKIAREKRLEMEKRVGKPCAKTYGGKPSVSKERRMSKRQLRNLDPRDD